MRNVLDYKCDQEHAKMQFIDHQCQLISAHLDGLLLKPIANHTKFRKPLLHRALSNGLESTPKA